MVDIDCLESWLSVVNIRCSEISSLAIAQHLEITSAEPVNFPRIFETLSVNFPWNLTHLKNSDVKSCIFSREFGWSLRIIPYRCKAIDFFNISWYLKISWRIVIFLIFLQYLLQILHYTTGLERKIAKATSVSVCRQCKWTPSFVGLCWLCSSSSLVDLVLSYTLVPASTVLAVVRADGPYAEHVQASVIDFLSVCCPLPPWIRHWWCASSRLC